MIEKKDKPKLCAVSMVLVLVAGFLSSKVSGVQEILQPQMENWQRVEAFTKGESAASSAEELNELIALSVQSKQTSDVALAELMSLTQWLGIGLILLAVAHVVVVVGPFQRQPGADPSGKSSAEKATQGKPSQEESSQSKPSQNTPSD